MLTKPDTCLLQTHCGAQLQEWYETGHGARERAREARKAGYRVIVSGQGYQQTQHGLVKMTLVTIHDETERFDRI